MSESTAWMNRTGESIMADRLPMTATQVVGDIAHKVVITVAAIDRRLEQAGFLSKLDENKTLPDEVLDEDGEPTQEYTEVCLSTPHHISALIFRH